MPASNGLGKGDMSAAELVSLVKRDVSSLSDADLNRLIEETKQESTRRKRVGSPSAPQAGLRSRWVVAIVFLVLVFGLLFKAETSEMSTNVAEKEEKAMAKPGEKGAWLGEEDAKAEKKKALEEANKEVLIKKVQDEDDKRAKEQGERKKEEEKEAKENAEEASENIKKEKSGEEDDTADGDGSGAAEETTTTTTTTTTTDAVEEDKAQTTHVEESTASSVVSDSIDNFPSKADDATKLAAIKAGKRAQIKYQYQPRSPKNQDTKLREELSKKWGSWTLVDPKAAQRPKDDFAGNFPNRDIPWDKFPANAWQTDQEYLSKFLPEAKAHIERAMEAMLGEYGWSKFDLPDRDLQTRIDGGSFNVLTLNMTVDDPKQGKQYKGNTLGGWITQRYFDGLVRRLMHALITEDTFTLVMAGHSAAAGHGNHFQQSYTLQFHKVIEPVFARLGIKLMSHNIAYGGLGTVQSSLAAGDILGKDIDILVWDSSMTENSNEAYDFFVRQTLLSGNRIPVLMGGLPDTLRRADLFFDAEVGMFGTGVDGVPEVKDNAMADSVIWAARYLRCDNELRNFCREMEYNGTCWIDRDDYTPETPQAKEPGGRATWHPGYKFHAIRGRIIAFTVLRAFYEGLKMWEESPEKKLPEDVWHVKNHYDNIRTKLKNVKEEDSFCFNFKELEPKSLCTTPFNGLSEMTPRVNPRENAIRHIMKPAPDGYIPEPTKSVYNPPDVFNPTLHPPEGEFDYLAVVENGIDFQPFVTLDNSPVPPFFEKTNNKLIPVGVEGVTPGLGWGIDGNTNPDECDGTYDGFCGRGFGNNCLLYGHNDHRGGLQFESYSGWGVFTVPNVKLGVILIRLEWWAKGGAIPRMVDWTSENNEASPDARQLLTNITETRRVRRLGQPNSEFDQRTRRLGGEKLCDTGIFEFAVNGKVTRYNREEMEKSIKLFQRVVHIITILDDPSVTNGEPHDIEFAVRLTGCEHKNSFLISHIYWA